MRNNNRNTDEITDKASADTNIFAEKSRYISSIAHDIRTPMNAVIMNAELAEKHLDDTEYVRECLANISLAGNYLMTLINNILDISKTESGKSELDPAVFSLTEMINNLKSIFRPQLESKNLNSEIIINKIEHDLVIGDKLRISQIFVNLASNAVKYTDEGGHIVININEETSESSKNSVTLTYSVEDNGRGIPEGFQKKMYNSFSRQSDDSVQGSGLGLSICRHLTELMGGSISCESTVGLGTRFTVSLELEKACITDSETCPVNCADIEETVRGMKLLIAEDNRMNRKIISGLLDMYGISTVQAENGQICLDILSSSSEGDFDAVLMDVRMPVMNGLETTGAIRRSTDQWFCSIPVIAMTADTFPEDIRNCLDSGMNSHLSKPLDINAVLAELYKVITECNPFSDCVSFIQKTKSF